jgi:hypothetical protein
MTIQSFAGLFSSLSYFFAQKGRNSCDYQLALQRFVKKEGSKLVYPLEKKRSSCYKFFLLTWK